MNAHMVDALAEIYADILEFHGAALRVFNQPSGYHKCEEVEFLIYFTVAWRALFRSAWKDFKTRFQHILNDLCRHKQLVESRASLIEYQAAQAERAHARNSFAILEEAERKNRHLAVVNWLSATDAVLDQEASTAMRSEDLTAGQWFFEEPMMKAWIDPAKSTLPLLWMNGIPGAGRN